MRNIYENYKTNIQISRQVHKLLKYLKKDDETFNDVIERLLIQKGVLK